MNRLALVLGLLSPALSIGALRTMPFIGAVDHMLDNQSYLASGTCSVYVRVNSGGDQQIQSVQFMNMSYNGGQGMLNGLTGPSQQRLWKNGVNPTNNCGSSGSPVTLQAGDFCHYTYNFTSYAWTINHTVCAGTISIKDVAAPGSVSATGSIFVVQESRVIGGVLSAALFDSGNLYRIANAGGTFNNTHPSLYASGTNPGGLEATFNSYVSGYNAKWSSALATSMNPFCAASCFSALSAGEKGGNGREHCERLCGGYVGISETNAATSTTRAKYNGKTNAGAADQVGSVLDRGTDVGTPGASYESSAFYKGGIVKEILIGPRNSICQGNAGNRNDIFPPVQMFSSAPAGGFTINSTNVLMRLVCQTRGSATSPQDLWSYVGQSASFPINSGNAF